MKVLNFGSLNIDYVYSLDHIVKTGETESASALETFAGGKGLNQSVALAKAGALVYHAGLVGNDGEFLKDLLKKNGADVSYIKEVDSKSGHAIIQLSKAGENSIFLYGGSNEMLTEEYIDSVLENFSENDIVVLQNEINLVPEIVNKAYDKGMKIALNPSPYNEKLERIDFNKLSYLILNEVEACDITKEKTPDLIFEFFKEKYPELCVMLTLGEKGSALLNQGEIITQSAYKVNVVDTTAAGDTFTGYFIAGITKEKETKEILKTASAAAALAVSKKGAAPSIPTMAEVLSALENKTLE